VDNICSGDPLKMLVILVTYRVINNYLVRVV